MEHKKNLRPSYSAHNKSHMSNKELHKFLIGGVAVVLVGIILVVAYNLSQDDANSGEVDQNKRNEIVENSICSENSDCVNKYGQNYICSSGQCYYSSPQGNDDAEQTSFLGFFSNFLSGRAVSENAGKAIYYNEGWVGIGTTAPTNDLHVRGGITGSEFCIEGNCIIQWPTDNESGIVSLWSQNGSKAYYNGLVGIGTTDPTGELQISSISPDFILHESDAASDEKYWSMRAQAGNLLFFTSTDSLSTPSTQLWLNVERDGTNINKINFPSGNVGIGTSTPKTKLEVNGLIKTTPQSSAQSCDSTTMGSIYYSSNANNFFGCRKSSEYQGGVYEWTQLNNN
ncbi:MAG: hypothetical protein Q8P81_00690 [Nanoarchaeota archaeon]|nr:hypothetical protein [Nanoarchaeota archaeon]